MAQSRIHAQDSVCKLVQNSELAKTSHTLRTVPGARNPFVAPRPQGNSNGSSSASTPAGAQQAGSNRQGLRLKFDFSTILLVIVAVIPRLFASALEIDWYSRSLPHREQARNWPNSSPWVAKPTKNNCVSGSHNPLSHWLVTQWQS